MQSKEEPSQDAKKLISQTSLLVAVRRRLLLIAIVLICESHFSSKSMRFQSTMRADGIRSASFFAHFISDCASDRTNESCVSANNLTSREVSGADRHHTWFCAIRYDHRFALCFIVSSLGILLKRERVLTRDPWSSFGSEKVATRVKMEDSAPFRVLGSA